VSNKPSPLISYAQNGEDIVLARALKPWEAKGFWVDCGAGHPKYDSVTKLFSQFGWTGINIEPLNDEFMLLTQDRPLDENVQCLLGAENGTGTIFAGPAENRGSSTTNPLLVKRYAKEFGQTFTETQVPIRTLTDILCAKQFPAIDFLKIDVEGAELEVLRGIDLSEFNPRILVIEATKPNSTELVYEHWEDRVLDSGYVCALFDGLNRFYVKEHDSDLLQLLAIPANVLDGFETIIQFELSQIAEEAQKTIKTYIQQNALDAEEAQKTIKTYIQQNALDAEEAQKTIKTYIQQFQMAEEYAASLSSELQNYELKIADHQQQVVDAEARNLILKTTYEALEKRLIELRDVERQLATIRSYKIFRILSLAKKIMRKASGRASR
jgi:FkbM family methyltransferase